MAIEFGSRTLPKMKDGRNGTILGGDYFNPVFERFDGRLHVLEELRVSWLDAVDTITRQGLSRIDVVLGPAFEKLGRVLELGFLVAQSGTETTLVINGEQTFVLAEGEQSNLFTPTSLLSLQRQSDPSTWAIVRLAAPYNRTSRELQVTVLSFAGAPGPFSDWELGALAGSTAAQYLMLQTAMTTMAQISADREAVALIKTDVLEAKQIASDKATIATQKAQIATDKAAEALASANAAALFDPSSYYIKGQTYTRTEVQGLIATAVSNLVGGAPGALDALNELAAALGNDANFATTMTTALAARQQSSQKNQAGGYAGLDGNGLVPIAQIPTGVAAGKIVVLNGAAKLPAVDGSLLTGINMIGVGQAWQVVTGSRAKGVSYQNLTSKPIEVYAQFSFAGYSTSDVSFQVSTDNSTWVVIGGLHANQTELPFIAIIPVGHYYRFVDVGGAPSPLQRWAELRYWTSISLTPMGTTLSQ